MSRKKIKSTGKRLSKKTSTRPKNTGLMIIETLEKNFKATPTALISSCQKEMGTIKLADKKLAEKLRKLETQKKTLEIKHHVLSGKKTSSAKKQLMANKKALNTTLQLIFDISAQLQKNNKLIHLLLQKQKKFTAIKKQLAQVEKELTAQIAKKQPERASSPKKSSVKKVPALSKKHPTEAQPRSSTLETPVIKEETLEELV